MFFRCFFCTVRLSIFERFVFPKGSKFNRLVWDSLEIWKCGLYITGCGVSYIGEVSQSDGGVENAIVSVCLYWIYPFLL